jgi:RNA polymerase sigma-70 factor (ECF subfamily)
MGSHFRPGGAGAPAEATAGWAAEEQGMRDDGVLTMRVAGRIVSRETAVGNRTCATDGTDLHPGRETRVDALHIAGKSEDRSPLAWDDAPDRELIEAAQQGITQAFDVLVLRYKSRVFTLVYHWTKNYDDALDVTQETFIRAYLALPKWKPQASWYTWLYRIAYNLSVDHHRARTRRRTESLDAPESAVSEPVTTDLSSRPDRMVEEKERAEIIGKAVDGLSGRQRDVFLLHHYGGLQVKEVADALDIAEGTAKIHLFRAVAKLRETLRPLREQKAI